MPCVLTSTSRDAARADRQDTSIGLPYHPAADWHKVLDLTASVPANTGAVFLTLLEPAGARQSRTVMNKPSRITSPGTPSLEQFKTFSLRGPRDLLAKLRWDIEQLQMILSETVGYHYQAMNCAVTAWQMCDWVYADIRESKKAEFPRERQFRDHIKAESNWLRICRELADASKHRKLTDSPEPDIGTPYIDVFVTKSGEIVTQMQVYDGTEIYSAEQVMWGAYYFWEEYLDKHGL